MSELVPFEMWHVKEIMLYNGDEVFADSLLTEAALAGYAETLIDDSRVVACAGVIPMWPGRYTAWAHFAYDAGPYMRTVTRAVKAELDRTVGRVELTVIQDFDLGHRWAKMLGFEVETPLLKQYGPGGEDHVGYVRIS